LGLWKIWKNKYIKIYWNLIFAIKY
jgi:hypothetical protein